MRVKTLFATADALVVGINSDDWSVPAAVVDLLDRQEGAARPLVTALPAGPAAGWLAGLIFNHGRDHQELRGTRR